LKRFSATTLLALTIAALSPLAADTDTCPRMDLCGKRIVLTLGDGSVKEIDRTAVTGISEGFFYFLIKEGSRAKLGSFRCESGEWREESLPKEVSGYAIEKLAVAGKSLYLLGGRAPGQGGELLKVSLDTGALESIPGIADLAVLHGVPVLLSLVRGRPEITGNGMAIPLSLQKNCRFRQIVSERLLIASDDVDTEVVDLVEGKSIHLFSSSKVFLEPEEYNLQASATDAPANGSVSGEMIFYKVYIDGAYAGRTETTPASLSAIFRHRVDADGQHLVKMERWELDRKGSQYRRANNIRQPDEVKLQVSPKRIMALHMVFNGEAYTVTLGPLYK
jgi:hypothetical protein